MQRIGVFAYGVLAYACFFATFLYAVGFVGGVGVPRAIDGAVAGSRGVAIAVDLLLLGLFAVQHSVMARPAFKRWWTQIVPAPAERSTYVLASSINHFDLFGLRQVWLHLRGQPYRPLGFTTPGPYRHVRHPLYVGWLLAFWATPTMTAAHLLFAVMTTSYILIAIQLEERDLVTAHGERYAAYRRRVPMLIPRVGVGPAAETEEMPRPEAA